ncbi:MAG TPA: hypothetical protein VNI20_01210 [Fimbriimonadaceae bacterium]|nr:hypothetical protein [Fimbriimonadaceae bacterium]
MADRKWSTSSWGESHAERAIQFGSQAPAINFAIRAFLASFSLCWSIACVVSDATVRASIPESEASAISANGEVAAGWDEDAAFRWSRETGMVGLGYLPGGRSFARALAVNSDGTVVVGFSYSEEGKEAFLWTEARGMEGLGDLPGGDEGRPPDYGTGFRSEARGVSASGSLVVGEAYSASGFEAFRWTRSEGMIGLGTLRGGRDSAANAVSADGKVVVGGTNYGPGYEAYVPFLWRASDGMRALPGFESGERQGSAQATNRDGSVVVGWFEERGDFRTKGFIWTEEGGIEVLPGRANAVSSDGTVVVGRDGSEAFRWVAGEGVESLGDLRGGNTYSNWFFAFSGDWALGVSGDGSRVVGGSYSNRGQEAFIWIEGKGMEGLGHLP